MTGKRRPRLADVQCSRFQFQPGDRLLVRVFETLTKSERKRLEKTVKRWTGPDVEILIIDPKRMELTLDRRRFPESPAVLITDGIEGKLSGGIDV